MEPKLPAPNFQPELPPVSHEPSAEQTQGTGFEAIPEKGVEQTMERRMETSAQSPVAPVLPSPVISTAPQTPPAPTSTQPDEVTSDIPLVAADEDLIEKEWVDKAKKIVEETKDDPYKREQEVGKLQADYLRKRYGKELGAS